MTDSNNRIDRIEALLEQFIAASADNQQKSNERMTRFEQSLEQQKQESNEQMAQQMARFQQYAEYAEQQRKESNERLTRIEQISESNNKFLEAFSVDLQRYTDTMNNLAVRIDGVIATNNQDKQETNTRLSSIQRQVMAIARHLGVV